MTATPLRKDNRDTYKYFGDPVYTYSLRQGIDDGFLAPYRVHRVVTDYDAAGWRPSDGELDRYGRPIPDAEYQTKDFERVVALRARTKAIARHVTEFLKKTDRFAKTIVFCVDQEHADEMRRQLNNLNSDLIQQHPDYVCRVTADEGDIGRGHLSCFQDVETDSPVILTTSQLLTTGVDAPTCKNIVLARAINSMVEFKQIIGRGTRLRDDYGKLFFNLLDFTQSTRLFADPDFDGEPVLIDETEIDEDGNEKDTDEPDEGQADDWGEMPDDGPGEDVGVGGDDQGEEQRRKYYVDGGQVEIAAHRVYEIDPDGNQLRVVKYTDSPIFLKFRRFRTKPIWSKSPDVSAASSRCGTQSMSCRRCCMRREGGMGRNMGGRKMNGKTSFCHPSFCQRSELRRSETWWHDRKRPRTRNR